MPVRLEVIELESVQLQKSRQSARLRQQAVEKVFGREVHLASTEALPVGQRRVRSDLDAVLLGELDRLGHDVEIAAVLSARAVGNVDDGEQSLVIALLVRNDSQSRCSWRDSLSVHTMVYCPKDSPQSQLSVAFRVMFGSGVGKEAKLQTRRSCKSLLIHDLPRSGS